MNIKVLIKYLLPMVVILCVSITVMASMSDNKPDTHNATWIDQHGKAYKANEEDCNVCHVERVMCITCHQDSKPRNHTAGFVQKFHGMESRWNRQDCKVCHKEDSCISCHQITVPMNHNRPNFRGTDGGSGSHCQTSCQLPRGRWQNTPKKDCLTCHMTRPIVRTTGQEHQMN